jgi:hypothetical protein
MAIVGLRLPARGGASNLYSKKHVYTVLHVLNLMWVGVLETFLVEESTTLHLGERPGSALATTHTSGAL